MIGIVGIGNMGGAIAEALLLAKSRVCVFDVDNVKLSELKQKYNNVAIAKNVESLLKSSETIILAVKPQYLQPVLEDIVNAKCVDKVFVSIAAGIPTAFIEEKLGSSTKVIRCMPNLPAKIAKSVTALCKGKYASDQDLAVVDDMLKNIGITLRVEESEIDKVTAVSGSGPGYLYHILASYQRAAQKLGFSREQAKDLVYGTVKGAVELIDIEDEFSELCSQVCSKGGTTEAGVNALNNNNIDKIFEEVLNSAYDRAKELAK